VVSNRHVHVSLGEQHFMSPQSVLFCPLWGLIKATFSEGGLFTGRVYAIRMKYDAYQHRYRYSYDLSHTFTPC